MSNCGKCHTCGNTLRSVLDGEEYCDTCGRYQRYQSHGWNSTEENNPCYFQKWKCPKCNDEFVIPAYLGQPLCPVCQKSMMLSIGKPIYAHLVVRANKAMENK